MNKSEKTKKALTEPVNIDQQLIEEGTAQLSNEIAVLEAWLKELEATEGSDSEVSATRKSYHDMLRSRREMLSTLSSQGKPQAMAAD